MPNFSGAPCFSYFKIVSYKAPKTCRTLCRGRTPQRCSLLSCLVCHTPFPQPGQANLAGSLIPNTARAAADE